VPTIRTKEKCLFLGGYQQGKTTAAKTLMRARVAAGARFAWYDVPWQARDVDAAAVVTSNLQDIERALAERKSVVYQPRGGGNRADMERFVGACNKHANLTVVLDEVHEFVNSRVAAEEIPNLNSLIRRGHHHGRGMWLISHRISDFPGSARDVHHVFQFPTLVAIDVENARDLFGDLVDQFPKMKGTHQFLYWGPDTGAIVCAPLPNVAGTTNTAAGDAAKPSIPKTPSDTDAR
jgi:hypothetical protein